MSENVFSVGFGKCVKLDDPWNKEGRGCPQIEMSKNDAGYAFVTVITKKNSSLFLRFLHKKVDEICHRYWYEHHLDGGLGPNWHSPTDGSNKRKIFDNLDSEDLKRAVAILKKNEEEPMSDEVKYYFKRTLRIFEFLHSNEGQKFINENNVRWTHWHGNPGDYKKVTKVYEQLDKV